MRRIVTHKSSDLDAISSVWLIKRFLPDWDGSVVEFVPAGEKLPGAYSKTNEEIEIVDGIETITVDTGMGKLDHHQTGDMNTCAAKLVMDFILENPNSTLHKHDVKKEAVARIVEQVVDDDHFQEIYYPNANSDIYEMGIVAIIQGYKLEHQKDDKALCEYTMVALDCILQNLEKKIWAEREIKEKGVEFESKWGKALAVETINDEILKLGQMMGYKITVRKDPNGGFIRIKALPDKRDEKSLEIDLTDAHDKLKSLDGDATWFLHVSKRMLLNGSSKNPTMKGTKLTLNQVIEVLKA